MPVSLAPAGRNIYSYGITKPKLHRSDMELNMPPRWGFSPLGLGGYNDVAPSELKNGTFGRRSVSRLNSMAAPRPSSQESQESENHSPRFNEMNALGCRLCREKDINNAAIGIMKFEFPGRRHVVLPLLGGEGRGEGERFTLSF